MATNASQRYNPDSYYQTEIVFDNFDDRQRQQPRPAPIRTIAYNQEYEPEEKRTDRVQHRPERSSKRAKCCSKLCLIGLGIGLLIGAIVVVAVAVPVGLINRKCALGTVSSTPNWIGTFQMDGSCDTSTCCCYTNAVAISAITNNQLQVTGSVTGACAGFPSTVSLTQSTPTGFQTSLGWSGAPIRLQLGQDSSYISFVNIRNGGCSASGLRTSYNSGSATSVNLPMLIFTFFITIVITIK